MSTNMFAYTVQVHRQHLSELTCSAHPLATASSRLSVVLTSRRKIEMIASFTAGMRDDPPMISTEWMLSALKPEQRKLISN